MPTVAALLWPAARGALRFDGGGARARAASSDARGAAHRSEPGLEPGRPRHDARQRRRDERRSSRRTTARRRRRSGTGRRPRSSDADDYVPPEWVAPPKTPRRRKRARKVYCCSARAGGRRGADPTPTASARRASGDLGPDHARNQLFSSLSSQPHSNVVFTPIVATSMEEELRSVEGPRFGSDHRGAQLAGAPPPRDSSSGSHAYVNLIFYHGREMNLLHDALAASAASRNSSSVFQMIPLLDRSLAGRYNAHYHVPFGRGGSSKVRR